MLQDGLTHRNGFVRKGTTLALQLPRLLRRARAEDYLATPPILANSVPKSGTHLLYQIAKDLGTNYGNFLSSMTSSFRFRERSPENVIRYINGIVPGEVVRGHLFYDPRYSEALKRKNVVHYFIYRDPRDVVISEARFLQVHRWHKLHRYFRDADDPIMLAIEGISHDYPDIGTRFHRYEGWLSDENCLAIRFEDLRSDPNVIRRMAEFHRGEGSVGRIEPHKSHTYTGRHSDWEREFTNAHNRRFKEVAGDLLERLGY